MANGSVMEAVMKANHAVHSRHYSPRHCMQPVITQQIAYCMQAITVRDADQHFREGDGLTRTPH